MRVVRLLAVATALAGVASFLSAAILGEPAGAAKVKRPVVLAASAVASGESVRADRLQKSVWAIEHEPPPADAVASVESVAGRVARTPLAVGRVLRESDFYPRSDAVAMSVSIGMRAYLARVGDVSQTVGFGGPGSVVDVMLSATRNVPQPFSRMIVSGVRVLAVRPDVKPADGDAKALPSVSLVTFELTPEQVEVLDLARTLGELSVVTRNPADPDNTASSGVRLADLLGTSLSPSPPALQAAPASEPTLKEGPPRVVYVEKPVPATPPPSAPAAIEEIRGGSVVLRRREP
jgi:pilus assembly protein CpaB